MVHEYGDFTNLPDSLGDIQSSDNGNLIGKAVNFDNKY